MGVLKKIVINNFRNIELQELTFSPNVNCISGGNGEGKTNLLDAIWYLSMTKSAFCTSDRFNYRYGCSSFALSGTYDMPSGKVSKFNIEVSDGDKQIRRDDKPIIKSSEHIGTLPIVMVSPADISMISESGEERRKFVNSVISQMDREYLVQVQHYNKLLASRNRLLKDGICDDGLLDTYDDRLSSLADTIHEKRKSFCGKLNPMVRRHYTDISGSNEIAGIEYKSDVDGVRLSDLLRENRSRDKALRFTANGIQRDDFVFTMNSHSIRRHGSQGQQKSFLVALKFAQYELMKDSYGYPPILLLDDLFDKLDMDRVANLLKIVSDSEFGQIFISDSNKVRINGIVDGITQERAYFETTGGVFRRIDE